MSLPAPAPFDSLPPEFWAVPFATREADASLQIGVIVRPAPDPVAERFVLLRRFSGGRVLLGCLRDRAGQIFDWLEVWYQLPIEGESAVGTGNAAGDERWDQLARAFRACDPATVIKVEEEDAPALPSYIDLGKLSPWHPMRDSRPWRVCTDEQLLRKHSLPSYGLSGARHGYLVEAVAEDDPILPLPLELSEGDDFLPLNPLGGRMLVRRFAPLGSEEFAALLAGAPWMGPDHAARHCRLSGPYQLLSGDAVELRHAGRHYFTPRRGEAGRMAEALLLKLQLAWQCMTLVRNYTARLQLPLLNLDAESFRVRLAGSGMELPLLWTASASLVQPGVAVPMPIPRTSRRFFKPIEPLHGESIYRPEELSRLRAGHARVRLRALLPPVPEGIIMEATLTTAEDLRPERNEMVALALPLAEGTKFLYGTLDPKMASGHGEMGFRTVPLSFAADELAALEKAVGVIFEKVPMEIQSPFSSPCDLYSLGVLTLRYLFAGSTVRLPLAKDSLFSLAASLVGRGVSAENLAGAVREILENPGPWREVLGPQHLLAEPFDAAAASGLLPPGLWAEVIVFLLKLFPARSPFAYRADLADTPDLALEAVYDQPLRDLQRLLGLTRSLHLLDWVQNREIVSLIESCAEPVSKTKNGNEGAHRA